MTPLVASLAASLWQAGAAWAVMTILHRLIPARRAGLRHGVAMAALLAVVVAWAATWWWSSAGGAGAAAVAVPGRWQPPLVTGEAPVAVAGSSMAVAPSAAVKAAARLDWQQVVAAIWHVGVAVGLVRLAGAVRGARRLRAASFPVREKAWISELAELADALGVRTAVALRKSAELTAPVVMGVVRPVIIVPASAVCGVPPEVMRAALAHELAHVARWDYVVELAQMVVEALLFFNPFVWLISRSIRQEREACCDLAAAQVCSGVAEYSEALLWWERQGAKPALAALAVTGGGLLGRVRRLLRPDVPPPGRGGWWRPAGAVSLVLVCLGLSALVIHATVTELTPEQRVAMMDFLARPFRSEPRALDDPRPSLPISGVVRNAAGEPIAGAEWKAVTRGTWSFTSGTADASGRYAGKVPGGPFSLEVRARGYAPVAVKFDESTSREGAVITLAPGKEQVILCTDTQGKPIPGARVSAETAEIPFWSARATADTAGRAILTDLPDVPRLSLEITAEGYEGAGDHAALSPAKELTYALSRVAPVRLRFVDEVTGQPLPGMRVRIEALSFSGAGFVYPPWNSEGLPVNADGEAVLEGLNPSLSYEMKATGDKRGTTFTLNPRTDGGRVIRVPSERRLELRVQNVPPTPDGKLSIQYQQQVSSYGSAGGTIELNVVNNEARGTITGLMDKPVSLYFSQRRFHIDEMREEVGSVTVDYSQIEPPATVHATLVARDGDKKVPLSGAYWMNWEVGRDNSWPGRSLPVRDGVAEIDLPPGTKFQLRNRELIGGRIDENATYEMPAQPGIITIPVTPAGMIRVKALEPDGRLADRVFISAGRRSSAGEAEIEIKDRASPGDAQEWFVSRPVPFSGKSYAVVVEKGLRYAVSRGFQINSANPIQDVTVTLPTPRQQSLRLVDEKGQPLPGVTVGLALKDEHLDRTFYDMVATDAHGVAAFTVGTPAPKQVKAQPFSNDLMQTSYPVDLSGDGVPVLVAKSGKRLAGRVIDHTKAGLVSQVRIYWVENGVNNASEERTLDADGIFDFRNAPDADVGFMVRPPRKTRLTGNLNARPGGEDTVLELWDEE